MTMSFRAGGVIRGRSLPCPLMSLAIWWIWVFAPALHSSLPIRCQAGHTIGALRGLTCKGPRQLSSRKGSSMLFPYGKQSTRDRRR